MPLIAWILAGAASACDPFEPFLVAARKSLDDAEVSAARTQLAAAYQTLGCQTSVIPTADLLALYRLDGVVSLAEDDQKGALYAVLRAVAADHVAGVSAQEDGPELFALYQTWAGRLSTALVQVSVDGGGTLWVDGRAAREGQPIRVAQGEHLVQVDTGASVRSQVVELSADKVFPTGVPSSGRPPSPVPVPSPVAPAPIAPPTPVPVARHGIDVPSTASWITGILVGGAGGGLLAWSFTQEQAFADDGYGDATYGGCARGEPCYADARTEAIHADTNRIRTTYLLGYSLAGSGGLLVTLGVCGAAIR